MTSARQSPPRQKSVRQLMAVTAATLPVVMLSSLALAQPAAAVQPQTAPLTASPAALAAARQKTVALIAARAAHTPAALVSTALPASFAHARVSIPSQYTVVAGDTVSAIAARYGLNVFAVLQLNNLGPATLIHPGQKIRLNGHSAAPTAPAHTAAPAPRPSAGASYTVKPGDTISAIATRHGLGVSSVLRLNGLSASSIIYPGQSIRLGGAGGAAPAPRAAPVQHAAPAPAAAPSSSAGRYTIKSGDTLTSIAARHGLTLAALMHANSMSARTVIYAGRTLTIPGRVAAASSAAPIPLVPGTFLNYTYPEAVVSQANANKAALMAAPVPSPHEMKLIIAATARRMGVDPALAMAFGWQESGFNHQSVSPANAIGAMQVIPQSGQWASELVGRHLNLLDPQDNATAGLAIIRALVATSSSTDNAIAGYYQGQTSVARNGMYADTKAYVANVKALARQFR
ncbi:LysM peptidoglycan-binding domain-containing protein [Paenarthrobacter sp. Z7-10]|uniref:LysM peptidoglycan-binding domain-containing protein n=1 Tax=Paenarthrobacter sp. Z7-10 TaxID=2787635 RepID=UPI0022A9D5F1|nr:lytic transglycosylase domain-containing protein [Paenarthrobacter sp. Z7-10]MCZ2402346.1 LysM peptidoglycan-binding domain-containing protein [Paenarthrobacter sp. Z7-10]